MADVRAPQPFANEITDVFDGWICYSVCRLIAPSVPPEGSAITIQTLWQNAVSLGWRGDPDKQNAKCPHCAYWWTRIVRRILPTSFLSAFAAGEFFGTGEPMDIRRVQWLKRSRAETPVRRETENNPSKTIEPEGIRN